MSVASDYRNELRKKVKEKTGEKELPLKPYDYDRGSIINGKSKSIDYKHNLGKFIVTDEFYKTSSLFNMYKIFKNLIIVKAEEQTGNDGIIGIKYLAQGPMFKKINPSDHIPYYRFIFKREINNKNYRKQTRVIFLECNKDYYFKGVEGERK